MNNNLRLPLFGLDDYGRLLVMLRGAGYDNSIVSKLREPISTKVVYLRHDVDIHTSLILEMARIEKAHGIQATYYIPLTLHFNLFYPPNQHVLKELLSLGHEVGLHYDLQTYPSDPVEERGHLEWEVSVLYRLIGQPIRTIVMHQPHTGQSDPFRTLDEYIHPHDPRYQDDLLYASDSCRAWRDENLLQCFGSNPPRRLMLNTHPELWLDGNIEDRMTYLDKILRENGIRQHREYFDQTIRQVWLTHPSPRLHDKREEYHAKKSES